MKYIIILLLASEPIYVPFNAEKNCFDQGEEIIEAIAMYYGPGINQGWYTEDSKLVYGFYCE